MAESKLRTLIISVFCIAFLSGCSSASNISPEIVCGKWQMYAADTGRNGKEQKQPITYTFMLRYYFLFHLITISHLLFPIFLLFLRVYFL